MPSRNPGDQATGLSVASGGIRQVGRSDRSTDVTLGFFLGRAAGQRNW
jgi:hypothetical protein